MEEGSELPSEELLLVDKLVQDAKSIASVSDMIIFVFLIETSLT
jgi:hypothetical protein